MVEVVADVREKDATRADDLNEGKGFLQIHVRDMWPVAQATQNKRFKSEKLLDALLRHRFHIGTVGQVPDSETEDGILAVQEFQRQDVLSQDLHRHVWFQGVKLQFGDPASRILLDFRVEDIRKSFPNRLFHLATAKDRKWLFVVVAGKKPGIVQAEKVVGVGVRVEEGVCGL